MLSNPEAAVFSLNDIRRHMPTGARALSAAEEANAPHGGDRVSEQAAIFPLATQADVAAKYGVSDRTVRTAKPVAESGSVELKQAVRAGDVPIHVAADIASLPKNEQSEIVEKGEKEILAAAKEVHAKKAVVRREERLDRIAEISKGNTDLDTSQRYPVIYADPPWRYENPPVGASSRSIENHYPTMTLEKICILPVLVAGAACGFA
ncbi:MAG: hypothetical protein AAFY99_11440 [Pseudomonadota bacterium]